MVLDGTQFYVFPKQSQLFNTKCQMISPFCFSQSKYSLYTGLSLIPLFCSMFCLTILVLEPNCFQLCILYSGRNFQLLVDLQSSGSISVVLVSQGFPNKIPQTWWLKPIEIYCPTVMEARLKSRCHKVMPGAKGSKEESSLPLSAFGGCWQ